MARHPNGSEASLQSRYALDPRALAAFRITIGLLLLWDLAWRLPDLIALYSDGGAVPRALVLDEVPPPGHFQLFFVTGSPLGTALLLAAFAAAAVGLVVGRFTRCCTFACWLLWCSWMARNPYVLNFGDRILRVALFWAIFLPLGQVASLDARREPERPRIGVPFAALAFQLQLVLVYFVGALHKNDPIWTSGQAISYVLHFDQVTRPLGRMLADWPRLMEWMTWATLWFEGAIVPLVFSPWRTAALRTLVVGCAVLFHLGLALTMLLGHFPFVCIAIWLAFLPACVWDRLGVRRGSPTTLLPTPPRVRWAGAFVATTLGIVLLYNAATLRGAAVPDGLERLAQPLGLDQRWTMFAPHPTRVDGWFVVAGHRLDGSLVDAWSGQGAPRYTKPEDPAGRYPHYRWMSYMVKLSNNREQSAQGQQLAAYLCRRWNAGHPTSRVSQVAIDFVQELTLPGGQEDDPIRIPVARSSCAAPGP